MQAALNEIGFDLAEGAAIDKRVKLFCDMLLSRESDIREDILFRQGRGQFHVSSAGHEGLAALNDLMMKGDWIFSHYRDKALMIARGVSINEIALSFFAKAASSSGGRQMVGHYCSKDLNIAPAATPTGLTCLPAAGVAWGLKRAKCSNVVFSMIGDASTRQGEFFEALAFSIQEKLPIIFVVEDNGYGISTPTEEITPLKLGMLPERLVAVLDGRDALKLKIESREYIDQVRRGEGPKILWIKLDRLTSHTASDDQTKYRDKNELYLLASRDPVNLIENEILEKGLLSHDEVSALKQKIKSQVREVYSVAELARDPSFEAEQGGHNSLAASVHIGFDPSNVPNEKWTMAHSFNYTLEKILRINENAVVFGEDVEDPKGGVFGLTKGLSTTYPGRVVNSPLAEATIAGLASGLSMAGFLPIFELQFIDFMGPAFNQMVNQIATLKWRSLGKFQCPMVIYAPCGAYIGGGPWHSQTAEGWLAHAPGLKICMPSNANDAAQMLYSASQGADPVVMLLPKNQFQRRVVIERERRVHPERARVLRNGEHVTIVAWGNCCELAEEAAEQLLADGIKAEVIDICSIVPCDWRAIFTSIHKTGRLLVVQEENKTCSFGQSIISEVCGNPTVWKSLRAPPQLVSRPDVHIGFSRSLERACLPSTELIIHSVKVMLGGANE